jgi:hypothetical protein
VAAVEQHGRRGKPAYPRADDDHALRHGRVA